MFWVLQNSLCIGLLESVFRAIVNRWRLGLNSDYFMAANSLPPFESCNGSALLYKLNSKVSADLSSELILDFYVAWDGSSFVLQRVCPPRMAPALPNKDTALLVQMLEKLGSLHTVRGSSV
jgi:hypothetical protein